MKIASLGEEALYEINLSFYLCRCVVTGLLSACMSMPRSASGVVFEIHGFLSKLEDGTTGAQRFTV